MSSIDNIVDKLIVKANKEKEEILKEANNEASQIREEALAKANYEKDRIWSDAKQEADKASSSITQHTAIRSRDAVNLEKEKIIDEVFDRAKAKLKNLDDKRYEEILNRELKKYDGSLNLYIPKDKKIDSSFTKKMERAFSKVKVINDENVESGFIIEQGKIRYNYDFSKVIDFKKNDLEAKVVEILKLD